MKSKLLYVHPKYFIFRYQFVLKDIIKRNYILKTCGFKMDEHVLGIDTVERPLYLATPDMKRKLKLVDDNLPTPFVNGIFFSFGYKSVLPSQDFLQNRIQDAFLKDCLISSFAEAKIWSSFMFSYDANSFHTGVTINDSDNTDDMKCKLVNIAVSFGFDTILKLVPNQHGFRVDIISCKTKDAIDHFNISAVQYNNHYPLFDFNVSVYKSLFEVRNVLDLAQKHTPLPEIKILQNMAKDITTINDASTPGKYPQPFIVIEGLDAIGKSTLVQNLGKKIGAQIFSTPPLSINQYQQLFRKQCEPVCRAFFFLGNYLIAEEIKKELIKSTVVLDRYYFSSAAYAIALEAKCGDESNMPEKDHPIYDWPDDLMKPSIVILLTLSEEQRQERMKGRCYPQSIEESLFSKSTLLRRRLKAAYQNLKGPSVVTIDASKTKEEVCDDVVTALKENGILL